MFMMKIEYWLVLGHDTDANKRYSDLCYFVVDHVKLSIASENLGTNNHVKRFPFSKSELCLWSMINPVIVLALLWTNLSFCYCDHLLSTRSVFLSCV